MNSLNCIREFAHISLILNSPDGIDTRKSIVYENKRGLINKTAYRDILAIANIDSMNKKIESKKSRVPM